MKELLTDILRECTGQTRETIVRDIERDFYLTAIAAKEYGLIDDVLPKRDKAAGDKPSK
jgi:ATP-dependent Clp protease protease subunit